MTRVNSIKMVNELNIGGKTFIYYSIPKLEEHGIGKVSSLPFSIKILLENLLRHNKVNELNNKKTVTIDDVKSLANWNPKKNPEREIPFMPARVILQDFTGVPCVADLAAMRSAVKTLGGDIKRINPLIPVDLVIDHSVQVDHFGSGEALKNNVSKEYERNKERYAFLRWAQSAFDKFRVVPPGMGIVHQVNLEYLATVVQCSNENDSCYNNSCYNDSCYNKNNACIYLDTVIGTDSHTTMINGLGVLGWGVGGIEADVCMLGQPLFFMIPEVVGVKLYGELKEGSTATDLVLTITQLLRKKGVVGKFVEFLGPGIFNLSLPDRATVANMAPEYGATVGFFPVDDITLEYLQGTNRPAALIDMAEKYLKVQGLFYTADTVDPVYTDLLEVDLGSIEPSLAGPKRPQDRILLSQTKDISFNTSKSIELEVNASKVTITDGSVVIAAITSCTNTSNPSVMTAAGLLAKKAVERGLSVSRGVKTSLAPGSRVVTDYLISSGLLPYLEKLGFYHVGYGCTTCIGNSGPLANPVSKAVKENNLQVAAVLSGNRNFEGRVHPLVKLNYLASPPLVVAYAIAGTINIDLTREPLGRDQEGKNVFLKDIWPSHLLVQETLNKSLNTGMYDNRYQKIFKGDDNWNMLQAPKGDLYEWDPFSTYILEPPFLSNIGKESTPLKNISCARVLVFLGDSITTDHISPAGSIHPESPAGRYLQEAGVSPLDFNSFGARRGNHEVMVRGTFGNIRLRNFLVPDKEGGWTIYHPSGEVMTIYDAAMRYKETQTPLLVLAGKEYGSGSSRDWAAKGTLLLGVKAVLAESFERIHRSNLIGMGVLPLQFKDGENANSVGLTGKETYNIKGIEEELVSKKITPKKILNVEAQKEDGSTTIFQVISRLDTPVDLEYYKNGGILPYVLRQML